MSLSCHDNPWVSLIHNYEPSDMIDTTSYTLYERFVGSSIILLDVLLIIYFLIIVPLTPTCTSCDEQTYTFTLPCGDSWCPSCLNAHVAECCSSLTRWPIRCCSPQQISLRHAKSALTAKNIAKVRRRVGIWGVARSHTLYCANISCLAPIAASASGVQWVVCNGCGATTCCSCRGHGHIDACKITNSVLT
ncbi:hypothetical protein E4T38_06528 [Aureobasidium subglaciale]|nr:hypothetical protein E4T38_06528 [Aureobasidium subglaciale]KAI5218929.1 hypothetical protein E4T40_06647 [Aureobasidium subglaciale]KAI5222707.1 hypothetical protein E4T41_06468 [Aureobasidium subglaciale]KAI5260200.1 hypothetical protein E4T46_06180 [Aureobasidium subglaciale]